MDKSWKDMPLGPSEKDHERWAKESAVRIAKQMDEALKKADTASTMTTEIKQVDLEMAREFEKEWSGLPIRQPLSELLATQRSAYEALIAELERERDALKERLEIPEPPFEYYDGILCRDETIALQDDRIKRLTDRATAAEARLAEAVEVIRPFSTSSTGSDKDIPDDTSVLIKTNQMKFNAKDFARITSSGVPLQSPYYELVVNFDGIKVGDFRRAASFMEKMSDRAD